MLNAERTWVRPRFLLTVAATAGLYVGAAKLGLDLPVAHGVITPVWAPSAIALAALLLFGLRLWPAVALGAFIANATTPVGAATSNATPLTVGSMSAEV